MIAYFDSSAIVKLVIAEDGSFVAKEILLVADRAATSMVSYAEARAALAAGRRTGRLDDLAARRARHVIDAVYAEIAVQDVDRPIVDWAGNLADVHGLRGYDAVHLASALTIGRDITMVTWDKELAAAARAEGLGLAGALT